MLVLCAGPASAWSENQDKFTHTKRQSQNYAWQEEVDVGHLDSQ